MHLLPTAGLTASTLPGELVVRRACREELALVLDWAAAEGWNPGLHDADCFYRTDPEGFWVAEWQGQLVGSISAVAYDAQFAFLGCFLVQPEYRYHGIGLPLTQAGRAYVGSRNAGLDGVVAMQRSYRRMGFQLAHRNVRFGGVAEGQVQSGVVDLRDRPWREVLAYDRRHFPAARPEFLQAWLTQPGATALGVLAEGELAGYGVLRPCRSGHKIGPLFADTPALAEALYQSLSAGVAGEPIFLDVPEPNPEATALAQRHGLQPVFETARMYLGAAPDLPLHEIYGITSYELG